MSEKQYRDLAEGEIIQAGDQWKLTGGFTEFTHHEVGKPYNPCYPQGRRPIPSPASPWIKVQDGPIKFPAILLSYMGSVSRANCGPIAPHVLDHISHWMPYTPPEPDKSPAEVAWDDHCSDAPKIRDNTAARDLFVSGFEAGQKAK